MSLWDWAGRAWAKPGVSAACLTLQDQHGQCVPLLLWALWLLDDERTPDPDAIETAVSLCRSAETVILPLRAARRAAAPTDRTPLLEQELDAERGLMDRLAAIVLSGERGASEPAVTLSAISAKWGRPLEPSAFHGLVGEPAHVG